MGADEAVAAAEQLAAELWAEASRRQGRLERARSGRVHRMVESPGGMDLVLALTDEVLRIRDSRRAGEVLTGLVEATPGLSALSRLDRLAIRAGARLAPRLPSVVVPAARERVRAEMTGVILPANPQRLAAHVARRRRQHIRLNVNVLGEAILGEDEAAGRLDRVLAVLALPTVDYVSVKISSICSQLDVLAFDDEVDRIASGLRRLYRAADRSRKFVNLDMEEYRDLELTLAVFRQVLDEPAFARTNAGIVLQAYLPDSLPALRELCAWARARRDRTGAWIRVRIVKGANLAMEQVDAELHSWPQAPFRTKDETDANYKRLLEVVLDPGLDGAVRVGVASHNIFEVAWAVTRADQAGARDRVEVEMLEGMAPSLARTVADRLGGLLLYAPIVDRGDIESAIAYLVRRLDENSGPDNFLTQQWSMTVGSPAWDAEAARFRRAVEASRSGDAPVSRRTQDRATEQPAPSEAFANAPDTDFTVAANRAWIREHLDKWRAAGPRHYGPETPALEEQDGVDPSAGGAPWYQWGSADVATVEKAIATARAAGPAWASRSPAERATVLRRVAAELSRRRGELLAVMAFDAAKTIREGDPEVSEAIDFAAYYADHIPAASDGFRPYGTVVVASPWNFPLSIPAGGVLAALAAGNAVILKPAPETVAVAGELFAAIRAGGVPADVLQFVPCVDGEASQRLITSPDVDAVVLTGSWDTARRFLDWRPDLDLHAETSGKNALVVTATADLDEAIADLVHSAFGHAGQKCSAASLAIVERSVYDEGRFLRRLADAVRSLRVGPAWELTTTMGPLIHPPEGPLLHAFTQLRPGESWLVEPRPRDAAGWAWTPGVKVGVQPGSPYHLTECFGPVLGVMRAADLDEAIRWQNQPAYGLTAGLHALDPDEIARWRDAVRAGNLYVNRGTTGAIVQRQPFGGWKRSVVGAGAKAGGPNYVASLGRWDAPAADTVPAFEAAWRSISSGADPTGLAAEANVFRYRPLHSVVVCTGAGVPEGQTGLVQAAAAAVGCRIWFVAEADLLRHLDRHPPPDKVRFLGTTNGTTRLAAMDLGCWVDTIPVAADPRQELLRWVHEQAVSERLHRHGNITSRRPGPPRRG